VSVGLARVSVWGKCPGGTREGPGMIPLQHCVSCPCPSDLYGSLPCERRVIGCCFSRLSSCGIPLGQTSICPDVPVDRVYICGDSLSRWALCPTLSYVYAAMPPTIFDMSTRELPNSLDFIIGVRWEDASAIGRVRYAVVSVLLLLGTFLVVIAMYWYL
jgi:hypothetical protein